MESLDHGMTKTNKTFSSFEFMLMQNVLYRSLVRWLWFKSWRSSFI